MLRRACAAACAARRDAAALWRSRRLCAAATDSDDFSVAAAEAAVAAEVAALRASLRLSPGEPLRIALGLSGGVDSAVAGALLARCGAQLRPLFVRSWDEAEERDLAGRSCTYADDIAAAHAVMAHPALSGAAPLAELDAVRDYWADVFQPFLATAAAGGTPNPDLRCNRHVKFGAMQAAALRAGAHAFATGHYARIRRDLDGDDVALLRGVDAAKDQSYFLASVPGSALRRALFPLGALRKRHVRAVAAALGLPAASRRSSAGICFVGRRPFATFLEGYLPRQPGRFLSVHGGADLGPHAGRDGYTHGQRARLGGCSEAHYVVGKRAADAAVFLAPGGTHPALYAHTATVGGLFWVAGAPPPALLAASDRGAAWMDLQAKARYLQPPAAVRVSLGVDDASAGDAEFAPSAFCTPLSAAAAAAEAGLPGRDAAATMRVRFAAPARALTPGQAMVLYDGEVCLGGGVIRHPGPTLHETGEAAPDSASDASDD
jgi:tRNA (5-methylaminomethyl-2-thiouridylate)-methyltransferase